MSDNDIYYQASLSSQIPDDDQGEFAAMRMLVMKLEEALFNAENELKAEEKKVVQFKDSALAAEAVVAEAKKMVTYFSLVLSSVIKSIASTQETGRNALKNIEKQEPAVAKAKEKVDDLTEELKNARLALKVAEEAIYGLNIAPHTVPSYATASTAVGRSEDGDRNSLCTSSCHSICEQCLK